MPGDGTSTVNVAGGIMRLRTAFCTMGLLFLGGEKGGAGSLVDERKRLWEPLRMPRAARVAPGGMLFHVLNRDVDPMQLFSKQTGRVTT